MLLSYVFTYWAYVCVWTSLCSLTQGLAHVGTREPKPRSWAYPMPNRLTESFQLGNPQWRKPRWKQNHKVEALTSPHLPSSSPFHHWTTLMLLPRKKEKATEADKCVVSYNLEEAWQRKQHRVKGRKCQRCHIEQINAFCWGLLDLVYKLSEGTQTPNQ